MRIVILVERVVDALFEDLVRIVWAVWPLWAGFCLRQSETSQEFTEIVRVVFDIEFVVEKVLSLL